MKFPLPELSDNKFTLCKYPLPDAPTGFRKRIHHYDNGICAGCGKTSVRTCRVGDLPNLCQPCYTWMKNYSHMDDPYHIKRIKAGTPIEDELVKKAIRYAKVKTMDVAGVTNMTTGAILLHAYKEYKKALEEGAGEEEARARQLYIEEQELLRRQAEMEEQARLEERRRELARKMQENQRILDAQQARLERLSAGNKLKPQLIKEEKTQRETVGKIKTNKVLSCKEKKIDEVETLPKWKVILGIGVVLFLISYMPNLLWIIIGIYLLKVWLKNR